MNPRSDTRQNIQTKLDFSSMRSGETREAGREETESHPTVSDPESPASKRRNFSNRRVRTRMHGGVAGVGG